MNLSQLRWRAVVMSDLSQICTGYQRTSQCIHIQCLLLIPSWIMLDRDSLRSMSIGQKLSRTGSSHDLRVGAEVATAGFQFGGHQWYPLQPGRLLFWANAASWSSARRRGGVISIDFSFSGVVSQENAWQIMGCSDFGDLILIFLKVFEDSTSLFSRF